MAKRAPAVIDGEIQYTSVSSMKKFEECPRRWWFRYVARLPEPQSLAADKGQQVHLRLEDYLRDGKDVGADEIGKIAREGLKYLPEPKSPGLMIEEKLEGTCGACGEEYSSHVDKGHDYVWPKVVLKAADLRLIGRIDLIVNRAGEPLQIVDHKTTSDIGRYAETEESLTTNLQMLGYGRWAKDRFPDAETVTLSHVYYKTKRPLKAERVDTPTPLRLKVVQESWHSVADGLAEGMKSVAANPKFETVTKNEDACFSYGKRCPYFDKCQGNESPMEKISMSLLNRLQNKNGVEIPPGAMTVDGPKFSPQQQEHFEIDDNGFKKVGKLTIEEPVPAILPPDAPPSNPELESECEACAGAGSPGKQHLKAECPTLNPPPVVEKKRRGRPKKGEVVIQIPEGQRAEVGAMLGAVNPPSSITVTPSLKEGEAGQPSPVNTVATPETILAPTVTVEGASAPARETELDAGPGVAKAGTFDLYIDCVPSIPFQNLDRYIADLHTEVIVNGLSTVDMALVEYGKGAGLMRAAAGANPPGVGAWVVFSSALANPVIDALVSRARFVVRGMR